MYYIIYETTNLINNKKYRGMHQTETLEDGYLGSGSYLWNAINKYGKKNFTKIILEHCSSYNEMIEREKFYVDDEWIKSEDNYNLKTGGHSAGILLEESKKKISETLKEGYASGRIKISNEQKQKMSEIQIGNKHSLGRDPWNKGLKIETPPWNKGLKGAQEGWNKGLKIGPHSDESNEKRSETMKKWFETNEHPRKGKESWNKGLKGAQKAWNKGLKAEMSECPHCGKIANAGNLQRWHMDNCKFKDII